MKTNGLRFGNIYHIRSGVSAADAGQCKQLLRQKADEQALSIVIHDNSVYPDVMDVYTREHAALAERPGLNREVQQALLTELRADRALWMETAKSNLVDEFKPQLETALLSGNPDAILRTVHALDQAFTQTRDHYDRLYQQEAGALDDSHASLERDAWVQAMLTALYEGRYAFPSRNDPDARTVMEALQRDAFDVETGKLVHADGWPARIQTWKRQLTGLFPWM